MHRAALLVLSGLLVAGSARAGLFDPEKPALEISGDALPFEIFRDRLGDLMVAGDSTRETKQRKQMLKARAALQNLTNPTATELVRRGILALRLRDTDAAFADLHHAAQQDRQNYWAASALGTAHLQSGQYVEAERNLAAAHDMLPEPWPIPPESAAALRTENALRTLAKLRMAERARSARAPLTIDELFNVRFSGPNGEYEAGKIDPAELAKLPPDAIATVQQLLLWLPDDSRLYWLLGELYNARGDVDSAFAIFDECINRFDAPELRRHRQVLRDAIANRPKPSDGESWMPTQRRWIIAGVIAVPIITGLIFFQMRQFARRFRGSKGRKA